VPTDSRRSDAARAELDSQAAIEHTLSIIGDRWSFLIVRAALRGLRRFDEFVDDLGIARPVLTDRLKRLVDHGVLEKHPYQQRPVRCEYRLTDAGLCLSPVLVALVRWSEDHVPHVRPSTALVHAPCGTELEQAFWCRTCATTFGPTGVRGVRCD
jgi:DNA-binding HxlR family transcriptional regulator